MCADCVDDRDGHVANNERVVDVHDVLGNDGGNSGQVVEVVEVGYHVGCRKPLGGDQGGSGECREGHGFEQHDECVWNVELEEVIVNGMPENSDGNVGEELRRSVAKSLLYTVVDAKVD